MVVHIKETITPMAVELMDEAVKHASERSAPIVLTLNTPGGNLAATFLG